MGKSTLNRTDLNKDVGLYITKSRRVVLDADIGELAIWIKAGTAGDVVYQDVQGGGEAQVWSLEAGEVAPLVFDKILTSATIDGNLESTTATNMIWGTSPQQISKKPSYDN